MPGNTAHLFALDGDELRLTTARLLASDDGHAVVQAPDGGSFTARRAAGCLLDPAAGDLVLVARGRPAWILQVLERGEAPARLTLPADSVLASASGGLRLEGGSVALAASEAIEAEAPRVALSGLSGEARFGQLDFAAARCNGRVGRLQLLARVVETTAGRLLQNLGDCLRRVRRLDDTRAGQSSLRVQGRIDQHASDMHLAAQADMKLDGERIRLG